MTDSPLTDGTAISYYRILEKDRERRYASAQELAADLKALASSPSGEQPAAKTSPSIAVLPFVNMSADPENEYFCDGLAEELLNALSKIEARRVAARTSSFSFKGRQTDVSEIGQKLKVSTVLEGSVRKAGNRLRITVQLINVADGYHVWSELYDCEMQDILTRRKGPYLCRIRNGPLRTMIRLKNWQGFITSRSRSNSPEAPLNSSSQYMSTPKATR